MVGLWQLGLFYHPASHEYGWKSDIGLKTFESHAMLSMTPCLKEKNTESMHSNLQCIKLHFKIA